MVRTNYTNRRMNSQSGQRLYLRGMPIYQGKKILDNEYVFNLSEKPAPDWIKSTGDQISHSLLEYYRSDGSPDSELVRQAETINGYGCVCNHYVSFIYPGSPCENQRIASVRINGPKQTLKIKAENDISNIISSILGDERIDKLIDA